MIDMNYLIKTIKKKNNYMNYSETTLQLTPNQEYRMNK